MKIVIVENKIKYTLSNQDLEVGDRVFPISEGIVEDGEYIHKRIWSSRHYDNSLMSGLPDNAHIIVDLNYSTYKPYEIRTDRGFGPIEKYFRIVNQEKVTLIKTSAK